MKKILLPLVITLTTLSLSSFGSEKKHGTIPIDDITGPMNKKRDISISYNHDEVYFSAIPDQSSSHAIYRTKKTNTGQWSKPEVVKFSGTYVDMEPFLTRDGLTLYFASKRPLSEKQTSNNYDIWKVMRNNTNEAWSNPINLGSEINTEFNESFPSLTADGHLYFTSDNPMNLGSNIYFSKFDNGVFSKPKVLPDTINTDGYEFNAYVDTNEKFIIFSGFLNNDYSNSELFISFKDEHGNWGKSRPMTKLVNSISGESSPYVDQKEGMLIFTRKNSGTSEYISVRLSQAIEHLNSLN